MDFDTIAPIYDRLASIVFGNNLNLAKKANLSLIKPGSSVLVIGGGTGEILEFIDKSTSGCLIYFCEKSEQMILRAKSRQLKHTTVIYLNMDVFNLPYKHYDVIISNFFLDMLKERQVIHLIDMFKPMTNNKTTWLLSDFKNTSIVRNIFIKTMYLFFALTSKSRVFRFPNIDILFKQAGFDCISEKKFWNNTIFASVYEPQKA